MSAAKSIRKSTEALQAVKELVWGADSECGTALVEFTVLAPIIIVIAIYTMDFGLLFFDKIEMQNAAQAGIQWAITNRVYNSAAIQSAAKNATNLPTTQITVSLIPPGGTQSGPYTACSQDASGNAVVTAWSPTSPVVFTPNMTCNTSGVAGMYVTVTATATSPFASLAPYGLISNSYSFSSSVTARIQ